MKKTAIWLCAALILASLLAGCGNAASTDTQQSATRSAIENVKKNLSGQSAPKSHLVETGAAKDTENGKTSLPDTILESYYEGQSDPAFEYFHHSSIQKFVAMWVEEKTGDIKNPIWDDESFARITVLDHDFVVSRPDEQLYCCNFTDGKGDDYIYYMGDETCTIEKWKK